MKKQIALALVLVMALSLLTACSGNSGTPSGNPGSNNNRPTESQAVENTPDKPNNSSGGGGRDSTPKGRFEAPSDMLTEQNRLTKIHEKTLNDYDDPSMELSIMVIGATFSFNMAQLLDIMGDNGKFGDLNSKNGFYEKNGNKFAIGMDYTVTDSFGVERSGDRLREEGEADLGAGWIWNETSKERDGAIISRERNDQQFNDGVMIALCQFSNDFNLKNDPDKSNSALFVIISESAYEYVYGRMEDNPKGAAKEFMTFSATMSVADAKAMMESVDFTIKYYGKVENGMVTDLLK